MLTIITRQTIRNSDDLERNNRDDDELEEYQRSELEQSERWKRETKRENAYLRRRYASRGEPGPRLHRRQGRDTGPDPRDRDTGVGGTPYPGEARRL